MDIGFHSSTVWVFLMVGFSLRTGVLLEGEMVRYSSKSHYGALGFLQSVHDYSVSSKGLARMVDFF